MNAVSNINPIAQVTVSMLLAIFSCKGDLAENKNIVKHINGLRIQAKFLSDSHFLKPESDEMLSQTNVWIDDPEKRYHNTITILLEFSTDDAVMGNDVAWKDIYSYEEFKQRIHYLNFRVHEDVTLSLGTKQFRPVLSHMESGSELKRKRNIFFVFSPQEEKDVDLFRKAEEFTFTYDDKVFDTGILRFRIARNSTE